MSCKQIQELLPLYVGRDLEEKRERLVATHLEVCAACAAEANEYRESRQLLQEFAPPAVSEAVYANMRREVLRDIASSGPTFAETIANLFRPRLAWAMATVALIAFALFGVYLLRSGQPEPNQTVKGLVPTNQTVPYERRAAQPATPPSGSEPDHTARNQPRARRIYRNVIKERMGVVAMNVVKSSTLDRSVSPTAENPLSPPDEGKIMRVEMQTQDPNIRIIWFSQQNSKPITNSKGT